MSMKRRMPLPAERHSFDRCDGRARRRSLLDVGWSVLASAVTTIETLDAAAGVDELLLAREERGALVAQFNGEVTLDGRLRGEHVAARALHLRVAVCGMNIGLHDGSRFLGSSGAG